MAVSQRTDDEEWRLQCFKRWQDAQPTVDRHVRHLMRTPDLMQRRSYLDGLDAAMRYRVEADFAKAWKEARSARR